jgi:hypothetical protein
MTFVNPYLIDHFFRNASQKFQPEYSHNVKQMLETAIGTNSDADRYATGSCELAK